MDNPTPTQPPPLGMPFSPAPSDPNATIETDVPCRRCSYNLRGLTHAGRCPECGTPVGLSTIGDLLRYSNPDWLNTLARGMAFILWGILVSIVLGVVASLAFRNSPVQNWVSLLASSLGLYGAWLLTEPDPSGLGEAQYATSRKLVRAALLVGLAANLLNAMVASLPTPQTIRSVLTILTTLAALFSLVGEFAKFLYLEKLALRIPDDALAGRARLLRWGYVTTLATMTVLGAILAVVALAGGAGAVGSPLIIVSCFAGIAALAFIVFGLMTLFFYIHLQKALREQAGWAKQVWGTILADPAAGADSNSHEAP